MGGDPNHWIQSWYWSSKLGPILVRYFCLGDLVFEKDHQSFTSNKSCHVNPTDLNEKSTKFGRNISPFKIPTHEKAQNFPSRTGSTWPPRRVTLVTTPARCFSIKLVSWHPKNSEGGGWPTWGWWGWFPVVLYKWDFVTEVLWCRGWILYVKGWERSRCWKQNSFDQVKRDFFKGESRIIPYGCRLGFLSNRRLRSHLPSHNCLMIEIYIY